jgi:hypothetical protein
LNNREKDVYKPVKIFFLFLCVIFAVALLPAGTVLATGFDANKYVVDDGLLYTLDAKGGKTQIEGAEVSEEKIDGGKIYWLAAGPDAGGENEGLYKGWKSGIYFFGGDGKFISCLAKEDAWQSYVQFSPDGKRFVLDSGTYVDREFNLYEFDGFTLRKTFYGMSPLAWLDPFRFAFTFIDAEKGPRHQDADISGWLSVVVCDSSADKLQTVAEATITEDFWLESVDSDTGELVITKNYVKNKRDWADYEKRSSEEMRVPVQSVD